MNYVVKSGDTLYSIALRFNTTVNAILAANPQITNPNVLVPGQVIVIPGAPVNTCPTLSLGSSGPAVFDLQTRLKAAGFDPGPIDGIFGPRTQAAVIAFQQSKNLTVDGIVGVQTWTALGVTCPTPPPPPTNLCPTLSLGSTGAAVINLQTRLKSAGFDPGPIDGIFGPKTRAAVIAFQTSKNLVVDGIVGVQTWTALGVNCATP